MVSFIIIGRNEGWKLTKCFQSVIDTINYNKLENHEIIYVDSQSTDDSIERAKKFSEIKIFQIIGQCNAAIARNIGAKESSGDTLFFIDGDMEILPEFLPLVFEEEKKLKYDFVSGQLIDHFYDVANNLLYKKNHISINKEQYKETTGGIFLINRELWDSVNGMKTKYRVNEDLDLGLRLSQKGTKLLRKIEVLAKHHTVSYKDSSRMWYNLFHGLEFYKVTLLRDHYNNLFFLKKFLRENYTSILLLFVIIASIKFANPQFILIYLSVALIRSGINMKKDVSRILSRFIYFALRDVSIWFAFFLFWPKGKNMGYRKI